MIIREAYLHELPAVLGLARKFFEESPYAPLGFAPEKVVSHLRTAIEEADFAVIVAEVEKELRGLLVGQVLQLPFSHSLVSVEHAWYIPPEHRKGTMGLRLFKAYEEWAIRRGAKRVQMAMLNTSPKELNDVYRRAGYKPAEVAYMKEI